MILILSLFYIEVSGGRFPKFMKISEEASITKKQLQVLEGQRTDENTVVRFIIAK